MNARQEVAREGVIERWLGRMGLRPGAGVDFLENDTESLIHDVQQGRQPLIYRMAGALTPTGRPVRRAKSQIVRKEENYLWSTRRFPALGTNTLGGGTIDSGDVPFFASGVGDPGSALGYASIPNLGFLQTNMDKGGRIPTGRGFALYELAVSFNAEATPGDIAQLMDTCELRYSKNNDDFTLHHGPVRMWPGGTGVAGFASVLDISGGPGSTVFAENGLPSIAAVRRFKQPRLLSANESFSYIVSTTGRRPRDNTPVVLKAFTEMCIWLFGFHFVRQSD
jgi:hypothetical protein